MALRRRLRRRFTLAPPMDDEAAALLSGLEGFGSSGKPKREDGGARPDAARAASIPLNLELLDSNPETRGRR